MFVQFAFLRRAVLGIGQLALEGAHFPIVIFQDVQVGPHLLDLQVALLDQDDQLATQVLDPDQGLRALGLGQARALEGRVGLAQAQHKGLDGAQVDGQALGQEGLAEGLDDQRIVIWLGVGIHLQGAVEGQASGGHQLQGLQGGIHANAGAHALLAETLARYLDGLGQGDLLRPRQERDLTHLGQIHAHGIVDLLRQGGLDRCGLGGLGLGLGGLRVFLGNAAGGHLRIRGQPFALGVLVGDQLDFQVVHGHEELVEFVRRDELLFHQTVEFATGDEPAGASVVEECLEGVFLFLRHVSVRVR